MQNNLRLSAITLTLITLCGPTGCVAGNQSSNLVHPEGTKTVDADVFGHVETIGNGPVDAILIPAGGWGWKTYETFMQRNAARYTSVAVTPPGYANTEPFPMPPDGRYYTLPWCERIQIALRNLISARKLEKPILVGQGLLGDYHAMRFAFDHPDLVGGVVVIAGSPVLGFAKKNASAGERAEHVRKRLVPMYEFQGAWAWKQGLMPAAMLSVDPQRGKDLYAELARVPRPTMLRYFLEVCTTDLTLELASLKVPLLALEMLPKNIARSSESKRMQWQTRQAWSILVEKNPLIEVEFIAGTQRFILEDQPELADQAIERFVRKRWRN